MKLGINMDSYVDLPYNDKLRRNLSPPSPRKEIFKKVVVKKVGSVKKVGKVKKACGSVCHGSVRGTLPVQKHQGHFGSYSTSKIRQWL